MTTTGYRLQEIKMKCCHLEEGGQHGGGGEAQHLVAGVQSSLQPPASTVSLHQTCGSKQRYFPGSPAAGARLCGLREWCALAAARLVTGGATRRRSLSTRLGFSRPAAGPPLTSHRRAAAGLQAGPAGAAGHHCAGLLDCPPPDWTVSRVS